MSIECMDTTSKACIFCLLAAPRLREGQACMENQEITWKVALQDLEDCQGSQGGLTDKLFCALGIAERRRA